MSSHRTENPQIYPPNQYPYQPHDLYVQSCVQDHTVTHTTSLCLPGPKHKVVLYSALISQVIEMQILQLHQWALCFYNLKVQFLFTGKVIIHLAHKFLDKCRPRTPPPHNVVVHAAGQL